MVGIRRRAQVLERISTTQYIDAEVPDERSAVGAGVGVRKGPFVAEFDEIRVLSTIALSQLISLRTRWLPTT